jgi:hypothetical protein
MMEYASAGLGIFTSFAGTMIGADAAWDIRATQQGTAIAATGNNFFLMLVLLNVAAHISERLQDFRGVLA